MNNIPLLKKILWADHVLGAGTAIIGLLWYPVLSRFMGLPENIIVIIAAVTMAYGLVALLLALQNPPRERLLRILIYANWIWAVISVWLLFRYAGDAKWLGATFLVLQVLVVGGLAWLEGRHLTRDK